MKLPIPFPNPKTYPGHSGVDFGQPRGTPIPASGPGIVLTLGKNTRGGYYIWVQYDELEPPVGYHHMDSHKGCSPAKSRVEEGTQLGLVGSLGKFSTGPHLHSEVRGHATTAGYWAHFDADWVVGTRPAGHDSTPLHLEQDDDMSNMLISINDGPGLRGPKGKVYFALVTPLGTIDIDDDQLAVDLTWAFGVKKPDGTPSTRAYNLTYKQWDDFHAHPLAPAVGR